jgi:hypothetical protein
VKWSWKRNKEENIERKRSQEEEDGEVEVERLT